MPKHISESDLRLLGGQIEREVRAFYKDSGVATAIHLDLLPTMENHRPMVNTDQVPKEADFKKIPKGSPAGSFGLITVRGAGPGYFVDDKGRQIFSARKYGFESCGLIPGYYSIAHRLFVMAHEAAHAAHLVIEPAAAGKGFKIIDEYLVALDHSDEMRAFRDLNAKGSIGDSYVKSEAVADIAAAIWMLGNHGNDSLVQQYVAKVLPEWRKLESGKQAFSGYHDSSSILERLLTERSAHLRANDHPLSLPQATRMAVEFFNDRYDVLVAQDKQPQPQREEGAKRAAKYLCALEER